MKSTHHSKSPKPEKIRRSLFKLAGELLTLGAAVLVAPLALYAFTRVLDGLGADSNHLPILGTVQRTLLTAVSVACTLSWCVTLACLVLRRIREVDESAKCLAALPVPIVNLVVLARLLLQRRSRTSATGRKRQRIAS